MSEYLILYHLFDTFADIGTQFLRLTSFEDFDSLRSQIHVQSININVAWQNRELFSQYVVASAWPKLQTQR